MRTFQNDMEEMHIGGRRNWLETSQTQKIGENHINTQTQEIQNKTLSGALKRRAQHLLGTQYFVYYFTLFRGQYASM